MRFVNGPIPHSRVFNPKDAGWTPLREPTSEVFAIVASLTSVLFLVPAILVLVKTDEFLHAQPLVIATLATFLVLMIPVHEMIHALTFPCSLGSKHLIMGAWLRRGLFYVVYDTPISKFRILAVIAAPFIVVSSMFAFLAVFVGPDWRMVIIFCFLIHTSICTGDFITFALLSYQVPKHSLVHNDSWKTYWKSTA